MRALPWLYLATFMLCGVMSLIGGGSIEQAGINTLGTALSIFWIDWRSRQ